MGIGRLPFSDPVPVSGSDRVRGVAKENFAFWHSEECPTN